MRPALAFLVAATAACGTGGGDTAITASDDARIDIALAEEFTLAPGQTARLAGEDVTVRFVGVTADSRCPVDVQCVWEGDATVAVVTTVDGVSTDVELHFPSMRMGPTAVNVGGHRLDLTNVEPDPVSDRRIPPDEYRATFRLGAP